MAVRELVHGGCMIRFHVDARAEPHFGKALAFFKGSVRDASLDAPTFVVDVGPLDPQSVRRAREVGELVVIRRSSAEPFNFDAWREERGDRVRYVNTSTAIEAPMRATGDGDRFALGVSPGSMVQVIDWVRDLVVRSEEALGTVILHAAALDTPSGVLVIGGAKGAGKTTTLLTLLGIGAGDYFSGDKVFCVPPQDADPLAVLPWRDWPYVGVGTLRAMPWLAERVQSSSTVELAGRDPADKLLIDADSFEAWVGAEFEPAPRPVAGFLLPRVEAGAPFEAVPVTDEAERWAHINQLLDRSADTTFFTWQSYLVPDYAKQFAALSRLRTSLTSLPMVSLRGDISAAGSELATVTNLMLTQDHLLDAAQ